MIDPNLIRREPEKVKEALKNRNFSPELVDQFLRVDKEFKATQKRIDELRYEKKQHSGKKLNNEVIKKLQHIKATLKTLEKIQRDYTKQREEILFAIPNIPLSDVKVGKDDSENEIIGEYGRKKIFEFKPQDYLILTEKNGLIDTKRAAKVAGTRFTYLKGDLARLHFAIFNYAFDFLLKKGFIPLVPPLMVKDEIMKGLGYIEGLEEKEKYHFTSDKLYLIGTAEHSLVPFHAHEVLSADDLPKRYMAFTPAFRREAGSYGKDTKGIFRLHQFDKLEMVSFSHPEESEKEHEFILGCARELMMALKIPYRLVKMCTGDLAFPSAKTYDIEAWFPASARYRETHSCSNCTDFQARRLGIKFRNKNNETAYLHTLNGTAFAIGRALIAIIENYQTKEGHIKVPRVLQKYCHFKEIK